MTPDLYTRPTDNVAGDVTPVLAGANADANNPLSNAFDLRASTPFIADATTLTLVWDYTTSQRVDALLIPMHNFDAGLGNLRWQGNATDSWGSPTVNELITVGSYDADGLAPYLFVDLTDLAEATRTQRFWRLSVGTANSANVAIGEILIYELLRQLDRGLQWEWSHRDITTNIVHRFTHGDRHSYKKGVRQRRLSAQVSATDAGYEDLRQLYAATDGQGDNPFLFVLEDDPRLVWFDNDPEGRSNYTDVRIIDVELLEVSRGRQL